MILQIYLDDSAEKRLAKLIAETSRDAADLAECAVSEALLDAFRKRNDDPARATQPLPGKV